MNASAKVMTAMHTRRSLAGPGSTQNSTPKLAILVPIWEARSKAAVVAVMAHALLRTKKTIPAVTRLMPAQSGMAWPRQRCRSRAAHESIRPSIIAQTVSASWL
jgi:hypothetical protein